MFGLRDLGFWAWGFEVRVFWGGVRVLGLGFGPMASGCKAWNFPHHASLHPTELLRDVVVLRALPFLGFGFRTLLLSRVHVTRLHVNAGRTSSPILFPSRSRV